MRNVKIQQNEDGTVSITFDPNKVGEVSKSERSRVIASTGGAVRLAKNSDIRVNFNAYVPRVKVTQYVD